MRLLEKLGDNIHTSVISATYQLCALSQLETTYVYRWLYYSNYLSYKGLDCHQIKSSQLESQILVYVSVKNVLYE